MIQTNTSSVRRLVISRDQLVSPSLTVSRLYGINTDTKDAITFSFPSNLSGYPSYGCFAITPGYFFFVTLDGTVLVYDSDFNYNWTIQLDSEAINVFSHSGIIYDESLGKLFCYYYGATTSHRYIAIIDPFSWTIDSVVDMGVGAQTSEIYNGMPGQCYFTSNADAFVEFFSLPSMTSQGTIPQLYGKSRGHAYNTTNGKLYLESPNSSTNLTEVWEIDPIALTVDFIYVFPNSDTLWWGTYNPMSDRLFFSNPNDGPNGGGLIYKINPNTRSIECNFETPQFSEIFFNIGIDYSDGNLYVIYGSSTDIISYYS